MKFAMISGWHVHAEDYAQQLQKLEGCEISAVWDEDAERGSQWAKKLGCQMIEDYDEILADPQIEGIVMTAPTSMHGELLWKAAQAGKHIFTEKVLALTNEECHKIKAAVDKSRKQFVISFPFLCREDFQFAKTFLEEGKLGRVTYIRVRDVHNGSSAGWLPPHFYDKNTCGGGAMIDLGAHPMYLLNWFLGMPLTIQSSFTNVTGKPVEDNAVSVMEFPGGVIGVAETGFVSGYNPVTLEISGTEGALMIRDGVFYANQETDGKWVEKTGFSDGWKRPIELWVDAIRSGEKTQIGIDPAVALTKLMTAAYEAYRTGKTHHFSDKDF